MARGNKSIGILCVDLEIAAAFLRMAAEDIRTLALNRKDGQHYAFAYQERAEHLQKIVDTTRRTGLRLPSDSSIVLEV